MLIFTLRAQQLVWIIFVTLNLQAQKRMASRLLFSSLRQVQKLQKACVHNRARIGSREVVGFGFNGQCSYQDRTDFPMPAIRFKENTPDIVVSIQHPEFSILFHILIFMLRV